MRPKPYLQLWAALCVLFLFSFTLPSAMATPSMDEDKDVALAHQILGENELPFLEFQFSPIVSYAGGNIDGFGYGVQAAVFPTEDLGVQAEYSYFDASVHAISASLIYRMSDKTFEPYLLLGGGALTSGETSITGHIGAGVNYWVNESFALFTEARFTWVKTSAGDPTSFGDYPSITIGGRWSF